MAFDLFDISVRTFERFFMLGFGELNSEEQTLVCIRTLIGEVDNGGFHQWVYNSSGQMAVETYAALKRIGAHATASILDKVLQVVGEAHREKHTQTRQLLMEDLSDDQEEALQALDREFWKRGDDLEALLITHIEIHREAFEEG